MTLNNKLKIKFASVVLLAVLAGLVSYPRAVAKIPPVYNVINKLKINLGLDLQGGIHLEYKADLSQVDPSKTKEAMQAMQDAVERKINAFGVAEPVIYTIKSGNEQRLIVELAGIRDINEAKKRIGEMPFLEFKEEAQNADVDSKGKGGDLGFVKKGSFVAEFDEVLFNNQDLKDGQIYPQLVETVYGWHIIKKIETKGEGDEKTVHAAHILLGKQTAGENDPQDMINDINNQNKQKADDILKRALNGEDFATLANENSQDPSNQPQVQFVSTGLTGKNLKNASVGFQNQGLSSPSIELEFDSEGAKLFADITKRNLEKRVAILIDEEIVTAPTVNSEILDGRAEITGSYTVQEANDLVKRLNEGALPVPIGEPINQQSVEASLGQVSLEKSLKAGLIGLALVILFMIAYYRFLGVIASVALLIYSALMISIFKLSGFTPWQITLTLPGIAGFVLSIGMAVDANILIFERTKEEIRKGRTILSAVDEGFKRAWTSIRDGNMSSIITALILMEMGTGFVKGFAVTLIIGVLVSMFTAVMITRTILNFVLGSWIENKMWLVGARKKEF